MDTKRFLIATLLSVAVLILWQQLFPPPEPPPQRAEQAGEALPESSPGIAGEPIGEAPRAVPAAGSPDEEEAAGEAIQLVIS